ncbi:MAG: sulfatase-like hydrolase/transferase [Verrucomicrobia bacterium]|jgi:arylsulfatase A-like enzyme|nr:sulfatase-like hydrolase/transferase [Verrucomicrobiota bacterium]
MKAPKPTLLLLFITIHTARLACGQQVYLDFQVDANPTPADAPAPYNLVELTLASGPQSFTGLTDGTGAGSYGVALTSDGGVVGFDGSGPDSGLFTAAAYGDGFRTLNESDGTITVTFSGLDDLRLYTLTLFIDTNLFLTADVTFTAGGESQAGVDTTVPSEVTLSGLQPSGGELVLTMEAQGGGKAVTRGAALNAALLEVAGEADADAPTLLAASAVSASAIDLSWTDNSAVETGFAIERSSGGPFAPLVTLPADSTAYGDSGLAASTSYTYRVRALTPSGPSAYSNEATATTAEPPPVAPDGDPDSLTAEALSATAVRLQWNDNSSNEDGFSIERSEGYGFSAVASVDADSVSFTDTGLAPEGTYSYRVRAFNEQGFSAYSGIAGATTPVPGSGPFNVLMVVIDDMSASAISHPSYGQRHPSIETPALDRLCDEGLAFSQAYANWPACMPARQMFMSGKNVETSQWRNTGAIGNDDGMNRSLVYLHQHFHDNGYNTVRLDKVFHIGLDVPAGWDITEEPFGSGRDKVVIQSRELEELGLDDNVRRQETFTEQGGEDSKIYELAATDEGGNLIDADRLTDGITKTRALELLEDFATPGGEFDVAEKPFFLAVGFRRPHLPFTAPADYFGRFNWGAGDDNVTDPATPEIVLPPFNTAFSDEEAFRKSLEGYYACTAMTDDHIADLLGKLDTTGLAANTIVVVFGDNGYGLGEHNKFFSKGTPDNVGYHVPLIFRIPGGGRVNEAEPKAVTLLDVYPTLVELCGLPAPETPLDGKSLAPLLEQHDPDWVEEAYGFLGGSADPLDPLGGVSWGNGYKYYEDESGDPQELYAVGAGDRYEWDALINNPAYDSVESDLKARLDSLRSRSAAAVPPVLQQHAASQVVAVGEDALFSIREAGSEVLTVRWTKDGAELPGETATSLRIHGATSGDAGVYQAEAVDADGRTLSYRAELRVIAAAGTLFDWQVDQADAPFILDGVNGGSFREVGFISDTFGPDAVTVFDTGTGGTAILQPGLPGGDYRLYLWNPTWGNAASDVEVTVHARFGASTVTVDQAGNPDQWFDLGTFAMGPTSRVEISTDSATGRVAVDGFRFERLAAVANDAPVAVDDGHHMTTPDASVSVDLLANDSDSDPGDALSLLQCAGGRFGTVALAGGTLTYTPRPGVRSATETLFYQVTDGKDRSNPASVSFTVSQPAGTSSLDLVSSPGGEASSGATGTVVPDGTAVTLTATAHPGYQFYYWEGPQPSLQNPATVTASGNPGYTAVFRPVPQLTSYAAWADARAWVFPSDSGEDMNPDHDSLSNVLEYGFDLDPGVPESPPYELERDPDTGELVFRYRRSLSAPEGDVTVWVSPDFSEGSWTPFPGTERVTDFDPDGDFSAQEREIRLPPDTVNPFIRISVDP